LPVYRRRIGVIFQDFRLLPHLSVLQNVALPLLVQGQLSQRHFRDVCDLLDWVGLKGKHTAMPETLSGGEMQRAAIARAVIARPKLLLADEPTGNVDDAMAMRLMYLFEELNRMGTSIVMATHQRELIKKFPHPSVWLENGTLHTEEMATAAA
jgi:cell division transport system ATP-binding protein